MNNQSPASGDRAHTDAYVNDTTGYTMSANIQITPDMWNPTAVLEAMAHEIGHVYGLGHCPTCSKTQSVMATPGYSDPNEVTGRVTSPTGCDNQVISYEYVPCDISQQMACYYSGGTWNEAACSCNAQYGGGGGGGDPGYYDSYCTPYYWVYYVSWDGGKTWDIVNVEYAGCW
ncbi:MAG TPA: hypothetical protein VJ866_13940 [Pyrinomonadaceae bacterium]|nr:hypothetical protein [Pyrinomonadaceae bacterium]